MADRKTDCGLRGRKAQERVARPGAGGNGVGQFLGMILAGAAVVVCVVAWTILRKKPNDEVLVPDKGTAAIAEVSPRPEDHAGAEPEGATVIDPREDYDHTKMYRDEQGILRWNSGCRAPDPTRKALPVYYASSYQKPSVFSNYCDRVVAGLLRRRPGSLSLGRVDYYDKELEEEYRASLATPIRIEPGDTGATRRLKEAVIAARREIAERMGAGESLGDILSGADKELRRLHEYKRNLESEIADIIEKGELSAEDVEDVVNAANVMLEQEGLNPIHADDFVAWSLRLNASRQEETSGVDGE